MNDLKEEFCELWETINAVNNIDEFCSTCPFTDRCSVGHNGLIDYMEEIVENGKRD